MKAWAVVLILLISLEAEFWNDLFCQVSFRLPVAHVMCNKSVHAHEWRVYFIRTVGTKVAFIMIMVA